MTHDEYITRRIVLEEEHQKKKKELSKQYCEENGPSIKIGDVVKCHTYMMKVTEIGYTVPPYAPLSSKFKPQRIFTGNRIGKSGKPIKKEGYFYEDELIKKEG